LQANHFLLISRERNNMAQTRIIVGNTGENSTLPGTAWTADQVVAQLQTHIPGLASMSSEVTNDPNGDKVITFRARTGTKG
jgi:hypothetical protein